MKNKDNKVVDLQFRLIDEMVFNYYPFGFT